MGTSPILASVLGLTAAAVALLIASRQILQFRKVSKTRDAQTEHLADGTMKVSALAARSVFRNTTHRLPHSPFIARGTHSTLLPKLVLHPHAIEYALTSLLGSKRRAYSAVELVEIEGINISLFFLAETKGFAVNLGNTATVVEVLRMLHAKGCPMSQQAYNLLRNAD